ncbi:MAG: T9SS type A sorting domain-containing protein, partial [Ignavibacteriales bacterium]|nr:T9SS type A sorting domain-containing protein [Ignavibacteriales bacterium]
PLNPGNTWVSVSADSFSGSAIMRADAIRLLRSKLPGADLEFGRRLRDVFDVVGNRTVESWWDSPLGLTTYREFPLYNLGKTDLVVNKAYVTTKPTRWDVKARDGSFPITIPPGSKKIITVGFRPFEEETVSDTLVIESNDSTETRATLPLYGTGINYNFIMNASLTNEPQYNLPFDRLGNPKRPTITTFGVWSTSGTGISAFPYPIAGGNLFGIYGASADPATGIEYKFQLPDSVNGRPGSSGYYYVEYGAIPFTSNSESQCRFFIKPAFSDSTGWVVGTYSQNALEVPPFFYALGNRPVWLSQGDYNSVSWFRPTTPTGQAVLRADLLRIRKIPTGPSVAATATAYFGSVSIYDAIRRAADNYRLDIEISSGGESALRIDSMKFSTGRVFSVLNAPKAPFQLAAVNGTQRLTIVFTPDTTSLLSDILSIYSNDTTKNPFRVQLSGTGIGTNLVVEENATQGAFFFPANPVYYPDLSNMSKWQMITDAVGSGGSRMVGFAYNLQGDPTSKNRAYVEYFPKVPKLGPQAQIDTFAVYALVPSGSANSSPRVRYTMFPALGDTPFDSIVSQNGVSAGSIYLGKLALLRADMMDSHNGGATVGYIRMENDTALISAYYRDSLVNRAKRDTFVIRADAMQFVQINGKTTGVQFTVEPSLPSVYSMSQNFPNPFNPTTQMKYTLPKDGLVSLVVYDILGREIRTLASGSYRAGTYVAMWDGRNNYGASVASGVYFYKLTAGEFVTTKKMLMLK